MSLLRALAQAGVLRTLDDALAQSLRRLDPDTPDEVLAAAALASLAVAQGDAGFDPARPWRLVDAAMPWPDPQAWHDALFASRWVATPGDADQAAAADAPLVLEAGLLYLRRYREYERRLAVRLRALAAQPLRAHAIAAADASAPAPPSRHALDRRTSGFPGSGDSASAGPIELATLAPLFAQLFPAASDGDRQARAAALALRRALLLVTGGPGTGKTTTIARLLVLRIAAAAQADGATPRIALAAPTGRAAERMAESLRRASAMLAGAGVDQALLDALPTTAGTLHRLLGVVPDSPAFRHHADNPLPFDIVVVDEASMVDLPLMCKLAEAVADGAQLVLLGDPDQLPSVEAGDVLAAILAAAGDGSALADDDARVLQPLLGGTASPAPSSASIADSDPSAPSAPPRTGDLFDAAGAVVPPPATLPRADGDAAASATRPASAAEAPRHAAATAPSTTASGPATTAHAFAAARIHLQRGYRQSEALQLAPLADAVRAGDAPQALVLLRSGQLGGIAFHENVDDPLLAHGAALLGHWRALGQLADPAEALRQAGRVRLLTALREGAQGARGLNARIEAQLSGRRLGSPPDWFPGRLLLVTENSYRHRLFNGDVGVCLAGEDGAPLAWFPGEGAGEVRAFHPAALPAHESAFAMTVHKAQGSEFEEVWLQLPRGDSRVLSRELVYTGLTRARSALHLAAGPAVLEAALGRHASRVSGLAWRLGAG
ncbi:AAA family ATPase [Pseudoxanthomonas sp. 10H]|uniref:AAA family ATPase n=1 Tax=Pseudoxanthomonas sp. 10H TaxID=3242729 RepID=UPI0035585AB6